ncbi:MAG: hypothetical protein H7Y00_02185 [Fimbriimonadaceae bacterium]|nr:hypothetical protein [Chitinophagales bacterium]
MLTSGLGLLILVLSVLQLYFANVIIRNGNILKSNHYRYIFIGLAIVIVGALFKILHLPYADLLICCGYAFIGIIYISWTAFKKPVYLLDILKCVWVLSVLANGIFKLYYFPYQLYIIIMSCAVFIAMLSVYYLYPHQRHTNALKIREDKDIPFDQVD